MSNLDGRPPWPAGVSTSVATLRRTLSLASACRMARVSPACAMATVRVARVVPDHMAAGMAPTVILRKIDIAADLVGDTGIEPVTSSA